MGECSVNERRWSFRKLLYTHQRVGNEVFLAFLGGEKLIFSAGIFWDSWRRAVQAFELAVGVVSVLRRDCVDYE